jgi:hypothetical protein
MQVSQVVWESLAHQRLQRLNACVIKRVLLDRQVSEWLLHRNAVKYVGQLISIESIVFQKQLLNLVSFKTQLALDGFRKARVDLDIPQDKDTVEDLGHDWECDCVVSQTFFDELQLWILLLLRPF